MTEEININKSTVSEITTELKEDVLDFIKIGFGYINQTDDEDEYQTKQDGVSMRIIATKKQEFSNDVYWDQIEKNMLNIKNDTWMPGKIYLVRSEYESEWHERIASKEKGYFLIPNDSGNCTKWSEWKEK